MSFTDNERLELEELCHALVDGVDSDAQRARLQQMLAGSPEARRHYVRLTGLSASLFDYAAGMQAEPPEEGFFQNETEAHASRGRLALGALAAAAAVALAVWLGGWGQRGGEPPIVEAATAEEAVARLSAVKDCRWRGAAQTEGSELGRGQRLELAGGFAEITFDSGAQLTVEGPAVLTINSAWEATLERGTVRASVPPEARGFRVIHAEVEVLDLGSEFGMVAEEGSAAEVFVTKGPVEVHSRQDQEQARPALVLHENQARRFARSGSTEVHDSEQKLAHMARKVAMDQPLRPVRLLHWSFDEVDPARPFCFPGETLGRDSAPAPVVEISCATVSGAADLQGEGRFGRALRLEGDGFGQVSITGLSKRNARTVALWVKIPTDAPLMGAGAMLSWPLAQGNGPGVEILANRNPDVGALGTLHTSAGRASLAGGTPLRDSQWHHLAVVFSPGQKAEAYQVRQYVDGRLEADSTKQPARHGQADRQSLVVTGRDLLQIGRARDGSRFCGQIDELFVADRALSPQEIRQLQRTNRPGEPEALAAN